MIKNVKNLSLGAALVASLALGGTAAFAAQDALLVQVPGTGSPAAPEFARNAAGLTYGSAAKAVSPETEPDLIQAQGEGGVEGYVFKRDLDYQPTFKSPAEAAEWQNANAGKHVAIGLYDSSGTKRVGTFVITPPTQEEIDKARR
ncbi:hypothetical protein ACOM2C_02495 [Pseudarthrobacter sp. So.54]